MHTIKQLLRQGRRLNLEEKRTALAWLSDLEAYYEQCALPITPILAMRTQDLLMSYLLAERAERYLDTAIHPQATGAKSPFAAIHTAARARDHLRKAILELENHIRREAGDAPKIGVADLFKPLALAARELEAARLAALTPEERAAEDAEQLRQIEEHNKQELEKMKHHREEWQRQWDKLKARNPQPNPDIAPPPQSHPHPNPDTPPKYLHQFPSPAHYLVHHQQEIPPDPNP